eukprot:Skav225316  [mRNA]  locus=scaffold891:13627:20865:- [translate_table: standard]
MERTFCSTRNLAGTMGAHSSSRFDGCSEEAALTRLVHVDFDCLFGKGLLLERPEMVPFRLTQNCVTAMGITGVEGIYRQCCEVTMEVLRDRGNTQTLLSVLHVFVADPLLEITRKVAASELAEHRVQTARHTISEVEKKLNGMLNVGAAVEPSALASAISFEQNYRTSRDRGVGLSVKGQVDELIKAKLPAGSLGFDVSVKNRGKASMYDRRRFADHGLKHVDLYFLDGSCPDREIISKFLHIAENEPSAVAVHCKAWDEQVR